MNVLFGMVGIVLILVVLTDLIATTLSFQGGGRLTEFLSRRIWLLFLKVVRHDGKTAFLNHAGYVILVAIVLTWLLSVWLGLFLLLLSDPTTVLNSTTNAVTNAWEKFYFAGYTLSTLGNGDFKPGNHTWQVVTNIFAFFGLALVTVSITYIMPVLSAVILQVKLSVFINCLGDTPQKILLNSWNGENFNRLLKRDAEIASSLIQHSQNHKAYPIIHYFHSNQVKQSVVVSLAMLDEAISFLIHTVKEESRPNPKDLLLIRGALDFYLSVLKQEERNYEKTILPPTDWSQLEKAGIVLDRGRLLSFNTISELQNRRNVLSHLLKQDGWDWHVVYSEQDGSVRN